MKPTGKARATKVEDLNTALNFMGRVLDKATAVVRHFDTQTNILLGICMATIAISVTNLSNNRWSPATFYTLGLFSTVSAIISLLSIHPPRFLRKRGQEESLLYNKQVTSFESASEYVESLKQVLKKPDNLVFQLALEVHNLYKYYYQPKRSLFRAARNVFLLGIIISFIIFWTEALT